MAGNILLGFSNVSEQRSKHVNSAHFVRASNVKTIPRKFHYLSDSYQPEFQQNN